MNLKLALPSGRVLKIKADFPYHDSPIGYRVLLEGYTALVVGLAEEGLQRDVQFPDEKPITTEKHISSILDTADYYALLPWRLLFDLLPSVFDWREEEFITLGDKEWNFVDKHSRKVLEYIKTRRQVKEENIKERFGKEVIKKLIDLGFLKREKRWKIPDLTTNFYSLALPVDHAVEKLKRFKRKEEKIRLIYYIQERIKVSREELREAGFKGEDIKALVKRGIILEKEESIEEIKKPPSIRQVRTEYLRPLGSKSLLFGQWDKVVDNLTSQLSQLIKEGKSAFVFCTTIQLTEALQRDLYPFLGDRLVLLSSQVKAKEFIKRWFHVADMEGIVVLGSRVSTLVPMKRMDLLVYVEDLSSNPFETFDFRHFLYNLSRYYSAKFLLVSSKPPLGLVQREEWEKVYQIPNSEVLVFKRSAGDILSLEVKELIEGDTGEWLFLVNKSGYAYAYCDRCGWIVECPRCGSFLTLTKDKGKVFCASCGYKAPALCQGCGKELKDLGFGIEKAIEEIKGIFGNREGFYFDTVPRLGKTYEKVLVLHADNILSVPWFNSEERYFSYLWQALCIAKKRLVVQTVLDGNPILEFIKKKDWQGFCHRELQRREEEGLPPFKRLIHARLKVLPNLENLPLEVKKKRQGSLWELIIKVDKRHLREVLRSLRGYKPDYLEVL